MRIAALALATGFFAAACSGGEPTAPPPPPPGPPAVATVSLSRDTATLIPRQTLQFAATVKDANGNSLSGRSVAWGSANPSVATVATDGVVTAVAAGTSVVTATSEGKSGQATITVKDGAVLAAAGGIAATGDSTARLAVPAGALTTETTITVAPVANPPAHPRLVAGTAFEFGPSVTLATPGSIRIRFANAVLAVSADTNRLRLHRFDAGGWTEVPGGTVDLANRAVTGAITSLGAFAVVELTPLPVAAVTLAPDTATLVPQQTRQLIPTTRDGQGGELRNRTVTWASGTPAVVTVDAAGLVTAVAAGTATVTATSEGKSGAATITVKNGAVVGAAGGVVTSAGGAAQVTFPPGALPNSRAITITPAANPGADPRLVAGTAFEFEPSGGFQQPVTIKISYAGTTVPAALDPATLRLNRLTNGVWVEVPGSTVDQVARTVTGQTSSFSTYAVVGGVPPQQVVITFIHAFDPGAGNTCSTPAPCGLGPLRSWTVPADVYTATVELWGASGGGPLGRGLGHGKGGKTTATITVVPGEQYQVRLGNPGSGITPNFNGGAGGGSGSGYCGAFDFTKTPAGLLNCIGNGFGGGGATDLRRGAPIGFDVPGDPGRFLVAGGGGGDGGQGMRGAPHPFCSGALTDVGVAIPGGEGGHGGGLVGAEGNGGAGGEARFAISQSAPGGGKGGAQLQGGAGGIAGVLSPGGRLLSPGDPGTFMWGGGRGGIDDGSGGGGGGGGWYGGGGGASTTHGCEGPTGAGGGGGSSHGPVGSAFFQGVHVGGGKAMISYTPSPGLLPTTVTLAVAPSPATVGTPVTLTATVALKPPATGTVTGAVRFEVDGVMVGSGLVALVNGQAVSGPISGLPVGTRNVQATYVGSGALAPSAAVAKLTVNP